MKLSIKKPAIKWAMPTPKDSVLSCDLHPKKVCFTANCFSSLKEYWLDGKHILQVVDALKNKCIYSLFEGII